MPGGGMSYAEAIADAWRQVSIWQRLPGGYRARVMRHVARALRCYPSWGAIQAAIVRRNLAEYDWLRLAA